MGLLWELVGWAGAIAILGAFLAVSMGWLKAGRRFQLANLLGACAFIVNSAFHGAWPSVATNVAWCLISVVALFRMRDVHRRPHSIAQPQLPGISEPSGTNSGIEVPTGSFAGQDNEGRRDYEPLASHRSSSTETKHPDTRNS